MRLFECRMRQTRRGQLCGGLSNMLILFPAKLRYSSSRRAVKTLTEKRESIILK